MSNKNAGPLDRIMANIERTHGDQKPTQASRGSGADKQAQILNFEVTRMDSASAAAEKAKKLTKNSKESKIAGSHVVKHAGGHVGPKENQGKETTCAPGRAPNPEKQPSGSSAGQGDLVLNSIQKSIAGFTNILSKFGDKFDLINEEIKGLKDSQGAIEGQLADWADMGNSYVEDETERDSDTGFPQSGPEASEHSDEGEAEPEEEQDSPSPAKRQKQNKALQRLAAIRQDCGITAKKDKPVHKEWAEALDALATGGYPEKDVSELKQSVLDIENTPMLVAPRMNDCVWGIVSKETRGKDSALQNVQKSIIKGVTVMAKVADRLFKASQGDEMPDPDKAWCDLADGVALILSGHHNLNMFRRDLVKPDLNSEYKNICSTNCPITTELFGEDLPKRLQDIGNSNRAGHKVKLSRGGQRNWSNNSRPNYNYTPKSPRRSFGFGGRGRGGGGFAPYRRYNNNGGAQYKSRGNFLSQGSSPKQERAPAKNFKK